MPVLSKPLRFEQSVNQVDQQQQRNDPAGNVFRIHFSIPLLALRVAAETSET